MTDLSATCRVRDIASNFYRVLRACLERKKRDRIVTTEEEICVIKISSSLRLGEYHRAREVGSRGLVLDCLARQTPSGQEAEHVET